MRKYIVTFGPMGPGRNCTVAPLTVDAKIPYDLILALHDHLRPHMKRPDFTVWADRKDMYGGVVLDGHRNGGNFEIAEAAS